MDQKVNTKIAICIDKTNFEEISINDLLGNIHILYKYILQRKKNKLKAKNKN